MEDFAHNAGVKVSTVKRRYKDIPGIIKTQEGLKVISGTRYPCDHRFKPKNSGEKRYVLLKYICEYKYVSHRDLCVEFPQFREMLSDLLSAQLIQPNGLCNEYGANAYDCSPLGDELLQETGKATKQRIINMISEAAGTFTGAVISEISE